MTDAIYINDKLTKLWHTLLFHAWLLITPVLCFFFIRLSLPSWFKSTNMLLILQRLVLNHERHRTSCWGGGEPFAAVELFTQGMIYPWRCCNILYSMDCIQLLQSLASSLLYKILHETCTRRHCGWLSQNMHSEFIAYIIKIISLIDSKTLGPLNIIHCRKSSIKCIQVIA